MFLLKRKILIVCSLVPCLLVSFAIPCLASSWFGTRHVVVNPVSYISYGVVTPYSSNDTRAYLTVTPEPFVNYNGDSATFSQTYSTGYATQLRGTLHYTIALADNRLTYEFTSLPLEPDGWWTSVRDTIAEGYPFPSTQALTNRAPINASYLRYHWNEYYADLTDTSGGDVLRTAIYYQFDRVISSPSGKGEAVRDIGNAFNGFLSFDVLNADLADWQRVDLPLTLASANYQWSDNDIGSLLVFYPQTKFGEAITNYINSSSVVARNGNLSRVRNVDIIFDLVSGGDFPESRIVNQVLLSSNGTGLADGEASYIDNVNELSFDSFDLTDWLGNAVSGFVNTEIFPSVAIGGVVGICITLGIVMAILKIFAGG